MNVAAQMRLCRLALLAGRDEVCAPEDCPLWEGGSCALDQLTDDSELDDGWPAEPMTLTSSREGRSEE